MIAGVVNSDYEPVVALSIQGPDGRSREVEAVVDTGYNGLLALPSTIVAELGLPLRGSGEATLADGSEVWFDIYGVNVLWDGLMRDIDADDAADSSPLVGMLLMDGHDLTIRVKDGGFVVIQATE